MVFESELLTGWVCCGFIVMLFCAFALPGFTMGLLICWPLMPGVLWCAKPMDSSTWEVFAEGFALVSERL